MKKGSGISLTSTEHYGLNRSWESRQGLGQEVNELHKGYCKKNTKTNKQLWAGLYSIAFTCHNTDTEKPGESKNTLLSLVFVNWHILHQAPPVVFW